MMEDIRPTPLDLVTFLPYACHQLEAPFDVIISTRVADNILNQSDKLNKFKREKSCTSQAQLSNKDTTPPPAAARSRGAPHAVRVTAVIDALGRLTELEFRRTLVPTFILKIISLCIPFQPNLNKITIISCPISDKAICEISKCLPESQITELCFDESPVSQCNYGLLLQHPTRLKRLSLERCGLDDAACAALAGRLAEPPAALALLSLASNFVSDVGALALAAMLRSNRRLRYLNLSGNQITDTGALSLFCSLMQFSLTEDEIRTKRLRNIEYLKLYDNIYAKCYKELMTTVGDKISDNQSSGRKKTAQKRSISGGAAGDVGAEAGRRAWELVGPRPGPFGRSDTFYRDAHLHYAGNMSLSYLDVSYNHLSPLSVAKLVAVLRYQEGSPRPPWPGLLRAVVEGNPLPAGRELRQLQELADRVIVNRIDGPVGKNEKKISRKR